MFHTIHECFNVHNNSIEYSSTTSCGTAAHRRRWRSSAVSRSVRILSSPLAVTCCEVYIAHGFFWLPPSPSESKFIISIPQGRRHVAPSLSIFPCRRQVIHPWTLIPPHFWLCFSLPRRLIGRRFRSLLRRCLRQCQHP